MMKALKKRFGLRGVFPSELDNRLLFRMTLAIAAFIVAWWFDAPQWVQGACAGIAVYYYGANYAKEFWQESDVVQLWWAYQFVREQREKYDARSEAERAADSRLGFDREDDLYTPQGLDAIRSFLEEYRPTKEMEKAQEAELQARLAKRKAHDALNEMGR